MKNKLFLLLLAFIIIGASCTREKSTKKYEPTFESLEQVNPVPEWFKDAKLGIYFHWGVYSVPAYSCEWYPRKMYFEGSAENKHHIETYGDITEWPYDKFITGGTDKNGNFVQFAPKLKSEGGNFDPEEWAQLFEDAGAKFAGPVAEHHDGFSMWASDVNPWNAKDMGPHMDLVSMFADKIREHNMKLILTMHHAYNITGYFERVPHADNTKLQMLYGQQGKEKNEAFWLAKHKEIIDKFHPDIIWQDFNMNQISEPILLQFLAYYYNSANEWGKEVVATYKDAFNEKCAVLDYERGGATNITKNYWLTDDAISSSSWCYTEGIGYYSSKQVFHGFLDRVSKNGNLLINISPKADGTIPQEQKDVLWDMGVWLKKYGEAIYCTRAWDKYGEGPTSMGAAHGVFTEPAEGTSKDIRYTRSKDNTILYAIMLGWDKGQKEVKLTSLSSNRIDLSALSKVELINGKAGKYLPLKYKQNETGLTVVLPEKTFDEMAYALKLSFDGVMPELQKYVDFNCDAHYYLSPTGAAYPILGADGLLTKKRRVAENEWKLHKVKNGIYKIENRGNLHMMLSSNGMELILADNGDTKSQLWKIESYFGGLLKVTNLESGKLLSIVDNKPVLVNDYGDFPGWDLLEVCDAKQVPYKKHVVPCTVEAEDYDLGCYGDAFYDKDEINTAGAYRFEGVDIEENPAGGYNTGWTKNDEWMAYTIEVPTAGDYTFDLYVGTVDDQCKVHLEIDNNNVTGVFSISNTGGYQSWKAISNSVSLTEGKHIIRLYVDDAGTGINFDKIVIKK